MDDVFAVDFEDFDQAVLRASADMPVLLDLWADWCAPCHAIAPHLDRIIKENAGAVRLAKIEVDEGENMKIAGRYKVRGFPTIILFSGGEELSRFSGARASHWIQEWLDEHL